MKININGNSFSFSDGSNIVINNGKVIVDGKEILNKENVVIKVEVTGNVNVVKSDDSVHIKGDVLQYVDAGNSVSCNNIHGDVDAGNSVSANVINGNTHAGNKIKIYK